MNVLITGAGRRNYLVRYFQDALRDTGRVIACDASATAPALEDADQNILVPPVDHPDYFDVLLAICCENRVRLVIALNELELGGLASRAALFQQAGTIPLVASPEIVATCLDKWAAFRWLRTHHILTPQTYLTFEDARIAIARGELRFPLFVKPRWGNSSSGIELVENVRELELALEWGKTQLRRTIFGKLNQADPDHAFLMQERIEGQEYGIDVVNDLNGRHVATLARRKLAMRAGSTDRAISVVEPRLERLGERLGQDLAHPGSVDCDVIATYEGCFVLDINPRLGGGYPFSHAAGADLPSALIAWASGAEPDPAWLRCQPGVLSAQFDSVRVLDQASSASAHSAGQPTASKSIANYADIPPSAGHSANLRSTR